MRAVSPEVDDGSRPLLLIEFWLSTCSMVLQAWGIMVDSIACNGQSEASRG